MDLGGGTITVAKDVLAPVESWGTFLGGSKKMGSSWIVTNNRLDDSWMISSEFWLQNSISSPCFP
jgi:hypothetical protein